MRQCAKGYFQLKKEVQNGQKKYSKELKAQIVLHAIKGQKTVAELASEYGVHANQLSIWEK
jgi:transposase